MLESVELAPARFSRHRNVPYKVPTFVADNADSIPVMTSDDFACMVAKVREPDENSNSHPWIFDSGCTQHMMFDCSAFAAYTEKQTYRKITVGTKAETKVVGTGDVDIKVSVDGKPFNVRLMNVLHVPGIGYQFLSVSQISNKRLNVKFNDSRCHISF